MMVRRALCFLIFNFYHNICTYVRLRERVNHLSVCCRPYHIVSPSPLQYGIIFGG